MNTLIRYNGHSHNHKNKLTGECLGFVPHMHKATLEYLQGTAKADGFAMATTRYNTIEGALDCLVKDCNITGIDTEPEQISLFEEE